MTQAEHMATLRKILPGRPVTDPAEFNDILGKIQEAGCANVVCATQYIDSIPVYQAVSFRVVTLGEQDFYQPRGWGNGQFAPKGEAVQKLFREAGGVILPSKREDDKTDANVREILGGVQIRQMNGRDEQFWKSRTVDLRPGSPEAVRMKDAQLAAAQTHIHQVCETKAQLRAMRAGLGLAQSYTPEDARKPFVIPTLVANLDLNDPVHRNLAAANAMGHETVKLLYGKGKDEETEATPAELPPGVTEDGEVIDAETVETATIEDDFPEPDAGPTCACPCGCAESITEDVQRITTDRIGRASCAECYPGGKSYDANKHAQYTERQMAPKRVAS